MKEMGVRENNKKVISLPYGDKTLEVVVPDRIIFNGAMEYIIPKLYAGQALAFVQGRFFTRCISSLSASTLTKSSFSI